MTTPERSRFYGIGGSQAAAAAGLNPWCSPRELFIELQEGTERPTTRAMRRGNALEPEVCADYQEFTGFALSKGATHWRDGWKRATPDRLVLGAVAPFVPERGLEAKTVGSRNADKWGPHGSQDIPVEYWVQVVWYMHVTGLPRWDVAVWIEEDFRVYPFERELDVEEGLVERVTEWREKYFLAGVEPPPETDAEKLDHLLRAWRKTSGIYLQATAEDLELLERIRGRRRELAALENILGGDELELRRRIGEADGMESPLGKVQCKIQKGRKLAPDLDAIVAEMGQRAGSGLAVLLAELISKHSREGKPTRPLLFPRSWTKGD